jgi:hypothetical protein
MSSINTGRVIGAGLVGGLALNVVDMGTQMLMADDMKAMVERLHLDPALTDMTMANALPWIGVDFIVGILIVLNYAAMRPRFGPGPKTALLAGFMLYGAVTAVLYGFATMGVFTEAMFLKSAAFAALSFGAGSLAGGWAYKEN